MLLKTLFAPRLGALAAGLALLLPGPSPLAAEERPALIQSDDRLVLLGGTFIERARLYGHLETALQLASGPGVERFSLRNLGWSGDSVFGDARSYFGPPQEGRERLARNLEEIQPQLALLCYGTGEAMSVEQGWTDEAEAAANSAAGLETSLALFLDGYQALIDLVRSSSGDGLRELVLLAPPPLENLGPPLPDQTENNARLARFRDGIRELAGRNEARFVDLFAALGGDDFDGSQASPPLTDNGVHHSSEGYRLVARELVKGLGYDETALAAIEPEYREALRLAVVEKNRLFFHRWRPANETYLFLFRKHEQGRNAAEIPRFDPLIAEQEQAIAAARAAALGSWMRN